MRRITLIGDDLIGFHSPSFDDHVKLLVPQSAREALNMPELRGDELVYPEGCPKPAMRAYTPRRYDPVSNELDIDFVLHHDGPATDWATQAKPGQHIGIAGPRGSIVIPVDFDWHLLVGDETALPAIARRVEELPAQTKTIVVAKTSRAEGRIALTGQCQIEEHWITAADSAGDLEAAVRKLTLPQGEGFVWAAGEYSDIKAVRHYLLEERGIKKSRISAMSYWRISEANSHDDFV